MWSRTFLAASNLFPAIPHNGASPLFHRKQRVFRIGPEPSRARSEPLTARTDLESSKAREKGILAHHAILGELRGERSEGRSSAASDER